MSKYGHYGEDYQQLMKNTGQTQLNQNIILYVTVWGMATSKVHDARTAMQV